MKTQKELHHIKTTLIKTILFATILLITPSFAETYQLRIGYSCPDLSNPYWVNITNGVKAAARQFGVQLTVTDADGDIARQLDDVENLVSQKLDAIILSPWGSSAVSPAVRLINKARIPLIVIDIGITTGHYENFIVSDNRLGGKLAGEFLAKSLGPGAKLVHIRAQLTANNALLRGEGFKEVIQEAGLEIVAQEAADSRTDLAITVMENILQQHPDIAGVFAENDNMAIGALEAIKAAKKIGKIKVVGFDGNLEALQAIKRGEMAATIAQQPYKMGWIGIENAVKLAQGKPVSKVDLVPVNLIIKNDLLSH